MTRLPVSCPGAWAAGLDPVTGETPRVLILGSFPSRQSLLLREYYANPRNQFWTIGGTLFSFDPKLPYSARTALLARQGVALWDVIHSCCREGSADSRITDPVFNNIRGFLEEHPSISLVALNGSTAATLYQRFIPGCRVPSIPLPSTSPAHARLSLAEKTARWAGIQKEG